MKPARALRFLIATVLPFFSTGAFAIESYTLHFDGINGPTTRYVSPQAVRYVVPGKNEDMIIRLDRGTIIHVDHASRSYSEVKIADMRRAMAQKMAAIDPQKRAMLHQMGLDGSPTVTKLGAGETIAGFATERYRIKSGFMQMEVFAAPQLQVPAGYYDVAALGEMHRLLGNQEHSPYDSIAGCILKEVIAGPSSPIAAGKSAQGETVTTVDAHPVPASQFTVPAGYAKKDFQMGAGRD